MSRSTTSVSKDDRERVRRIIHRCDWSRIDMVGGYETEWTIENGKVYWADLDARKEYNATTLIVMSVKRFITKYQDFLNDDEWGDTDLYGSQMEKS